MDNFRNRIVKEFGHVGFKFFRETVWSSSLQQSDLPKVRNFLSKNNFEYIDVSLAVPQDDSTYRMFWCKHYDTSGQCTSLLQQVPIPAKSNHLKLTFCYVSEEMRHEGHTQTIIVVNALRLIFGVPIARELIFTRFFSEENTICHLFSDEGYASLFDTQLLNMFNDPAIDETQLVKIPPEAAILLDKSFSQTYPSERYVLMWLAFEAIINSVVEKGNSGEKRKIFFKDILKSDIVNNEVFRLFNIRCAIFKEGKLPNHNDENDCWSLYAAIQIALMKDCDQRRAFLSGYENVLKNRTSLNHA